MRYRITLVKLPRAAHTSQNWRIDEIVPDFRLEDVWALPTPGGQEEFGVLVQGIAAADPTKSLPRAGRALWKLRWRVGELLGWDEDETGLDSRVSSLRDRLPADLRDAAPGPTLKAVPFTSLYLLENEWAAEFANGTVHGVFHLGWVEQESGGYAGQVAVYVKPNGPLGSAYMAAIKPLRHLIVYPQMTADDRAEVAGAMSGTRMTALARGIDSPGRAIVAMGFGHVAWGLFVYRKPLMELAREGIADSVGDGIFQRAHSLDDRAAGFWFLFAAPMMGLLGHLVEAAEKRGDGRALRASGRALIGLGAVGSTFIPRSGFPAVPLVGWWMIRRSRRL